MIDITQIRTHGRLAKTLKVGDVIVKQTFHGVFAEIIDIQPDRVGAQPSKFDRLMFILRGIEGGTFLAGFGPDERVDLVVSVPEVETPFGPAVEPECIWAGTWQEQDCHAQACPKHGQPDPWPGPTAKALEQLGHERFDGETPAPVRGIPKFITVYEHPNQ